jgi:hypothetical protein
MVERRITQLGVEFDLLISWPRRVTQIGLEIDVSRMVLNGYLIPNPYYDRGYVRRRVRVGGDWIFLDGSEGEHHVATRYEITLIWKVKGADHTTLLTALTSLYGTSGTFADLQGRSWVVKIGAWGEVPLADNVTFLVTATLREVTP